LLSKEGGGRHTERTRHACSPVRFDLSGKDGARGEHLLLSTVKLDAGFIVCRRRRGGNAADEIV